MNDKDKETLRRMLKYCDDVNILMEKYHSDFENYKTDISFQYSCNMCIIQIGELVTRFSESFIEKYSNIPWHAIKAMRNLHAHDYERVDFSIVWNTLMEDIPQLQQALSKILEQENSVG